MTKRLEDAEVRLQRLLEGLPRDPLTLSGIQCAADRVERSASALPQIVQTAIDGVGQQAAQGLAHAMGSEAQRLMLAARRAEQAAVDYEQAVGCGRTSR